MLNAQLTAFLGWRTLEQPVKAAMPPFNVRPNMQLLPTTLSFNAPVFGPAIANATMALYASPAMKALASELGVQIPKYQLSSFVQKKAVKVQVLVKYARERSDCAVGANKAAVDKLEKFITEFQALTPAAVPDLNTWRAFCDRHCPAGWEGNLHFEHLLPFCFGFEPATAEALRNHKHSEIDAKTGKEEVKSLQEFSLRWLAKALGAYGPEGCLGDAVNLVLAMMYPEEPSDKSEKALVAALDSMRKRIEMAEAGDEWALRTLWVPTHFQHDGESDDTLSWLLAVRVCRLRGDEPLRVLGQMSADPRIDVVADHLASKGNSIFRDSESKNAEAVLKNFSFLTKK